VTGEVGQVENIFVKEDEAAARLAKDAGDIRSRCPDSDADNDELTELRRLLAIAGVIVVELSPLLEGHLVLQLESRERARRSRLIS
jgi:hypothetical protein